MNRLKKQVHECEKKYSDKEAEFLRYKEKENTRPEIRLQSELNILSLEKVNIIRQFKTKISN
jgi:centrosomal protein CEP120